MQSNLIPLISYFRLTSSFYTLEMVDSPHLLTAIRCISFCGRSSDRLRWSWRWIGPDPCRQPYQKSQNSSSLKKNKLNFKINIFYPKFNFSLDVLAFVRERTGDQTLWFYFHTPMFLDNVLSLSNPLSPSLKLRAALLKLTLKKR